MKSMCLAMILGLAMCVCAASVASGQSVTSGSIAGVVRDATGGVIPGVTVEASSPALIEKTRTVVTDANGRYNLVELRPGQYTVTFSLAGFRTVRREGVELTTGFTATVNAELPLGAIEETITVSGTTAVVDTQNVRQRQVFSNETLAQLPTSKSLVSYSALTAGITMQSGAGQVLQDVGGNQAEMNAVLVIHNSRGGDTKQKFDGMSYERSDGPGGGVRKLWYPNPAAVQEITLETSGIGAESETGGLQVNFVPKDGGNTFRGVAIGNYTDHRLQGSNLTDELRARGLTAQAKTKRVYDENVALGGPIKKDRLWFFAAQRQTRSDNFVPGNYFNKTLHTLFYTPDLDRPAFEYTQRNDGSLRLTWQAAAKHKITGFFGYQTGCACFSQTAAGRAPEAAYDYLSDPLTLTQVTWTYPATNRLLVQGGFSWAFIQDGVAGHPVPGTEQDIPVNDIGLGYIYGAYFGFSAVTPGSATKGPQANGRFSVSYVTGSHAFKTGLYVYRGYDDQLYRVNDIPGLGPVQYTFRNQVPVAVTYYASPNIGKDAGASVGLFAQDQWTIRRLTLNLGVRFDYMHEWVPPVARAATAFTPAISFPEIDVNRWKDISPRVGAAFDLFGNGRTAVKGSIGRYVVGDSTQMAFTSNPAFQISTSASRTWTDNGDYVPQANELGPLSNLAFGTPVVNTTYDPALLKGWGIRPYNWEGNATVQHELRPGLGLAVGYFRRSYHNAYALDNLLVAPADFNPFCVTAPTDARLPGGGNQICGYYDVRPGAFGQVRNVIRPSAMTEAYNGVDVALSTRFGQGGLFSASFNTGQTTINNCEGVDDPNGGAGFPGLGALPAFASTSSRPRAWCETTNPFRGQTQLKLSANYPLPSDFAISGVFQSLPGIPLNTTAVFSNAQVVPTLGRSLGACGTAAICSASTSVAVVEPFTEFEPRLEQLDLRLSRTFRFGRGRLQANLDVYNVLNASDVLAANTAYGAQWLRPRQVLAARTFKFGGQFDF